MGNGGKKVEKSSGPVKIEGKISSIFRDYAFAPGKTRFDEDMRNVLAARPQTILIKDPTAKDLTSFIRALQKSPLKTQPIRHLIVASHANPEGLLMIPIDLVTPESTYEDLEKADKAGSIRIPADILIPRPRDEMGREIPAAVHIKGCRVGLQPRFLQMLQRALGGGLTVTAPKHFHATSRLTKPSGPVEYMKYSFAINRPTKFENRQQAIREFADRSSRRELGFTLIDGNPVPESDWDKWLPKEIHPPKKRRRIPMMAQFVNPVTKELEEPDFAEYRYRPRKFAKKPFSINLPSDPSTYEDRKKAIKDAMVQSLARYRDDHPFPDYVRFGYRSMDEFMDGWKWQFKWRERDKILFYRAMRHEYVVIRPITDPKTNQLFLNFYPTDKSLMQVIQLKENDGRFFATV